MKIVSLNVNGIRAFYNRGGMTEFMKKFHDYDVICLQENKATPENTEYWLGDYKDQYDIYSESNTNKAGYSGVTTLVKKGVPHEVKYYDTNPLDYYFGGRIIHVVVNGYDIINCYTLNSGSEKEDLRQQWDKVYLNYLEQVLVNNNKVILVGDFNVCHTVMDHYNREKYYDCYPGCYQFEIDGMDKILGLGFEDIWRTRNPNTRQYTWFNPRKPSQWDHNLGWRLDYFLTSKVIYDKVKECNIYDSDKFSDHYAIDLVLYE